MRRKRRNLFKWSNGEVKTLYKVIGKQVYFQNWPTFLVICRCSLQEILKGLLFRQKKIISEGWTEDLELEEEYQKGWVNIIYKYMIYVGRWSLAILNSCNGIFWSFKYMNHWSNKARREWDKLTLKFVALLWSSKGRVCEKRVWGSDTVYDSKFWGSQ